MRIRRTSGNLLIEPPSVATGDIAFNLIIFFLVCASVQPDSGRKQMLPRSEEQAKQQQQQTKNVEVMLTRTTAAINGDLVAPRDFTPRLKTLLAGRARPEDRVVVVKSRPETPYDFWIDVTAKIEEAGGTVTIQREEERTIAVGN